MFASVSEAGRRRLTGAGDILAAGRGVELVELLR